MIRKLIIALVCVLGLGLTMPITSGQNPEGDRVYLHSDYMWIQGATGDLTAGATSAEIYTSNAVDVIIYVDITKMTTADGDDEVDFYFQTTYNNGTDWVDLENAHYANADNGTTPDIVAHLGPGPPVSSNTNYATATDGSLADDTKIKFPAGTHVRIKTTVTGATAPTYAYRAWIFLR
jgi:hypothetical protein